MKMKLLSPLIIVITTIIFLSCSSSYKKEIEQINALINIVSSADEVLHSINKDSLLQITQLVKEDIKKIQSKDDTLTRDAAFKADEYVGRLKHLNRLAINYGKMEEELTLVNKQLTNLKQDLENGIIQQKDFLTYYESEKTAVILINDKITHATNGMNHRIRKMYANRIEFVTLIDNPASYKSFKVN